MLFAFFMGLLALMVWLYATGADSLAMHFMWVGFLYILGVSILNAFLFLVLGHWGSGDGSWSTILGGVIFIPLIEELFKSRAARSRPIPIHSFALVCLFGIYELMLSKPFSMYEMVGPVAFSESLDSLPALAIHTLTAVLYSFYFLDRRRFQFATCLAIHASFNGFVQFGDFSLLPIAGLALLLSAILLFPWRNVEKRGQWKTSLQSTQNLHDRQTR